MKRPLILIVCCLLILVGTSLADEGRTPIFEAVDLDVANLPIGGQYVVTTDISVTANNVIRIRGTGVEDVEIDLNGFTLEAGASGGNVIDAKDLRTLTVRNGVIRHQGTGASGILVQATDSAIVEQMKISGGRYGVWISLGVTSFAIRDNTISETNDNGILVNYAGSTDPEVAEGSIDDNTLRDCGDAASAPNGGRGIEVRFGVSSVAIRRNRIERPHTYGITVNSRGAVVIDGNRVNETGYRGIIASATGACRVSNNVVQNAGVLGSEVENLGGDGIFINDTASNCLLLNNVSTNNYMSGLRVEGDRCHIDGNVLNDNRLAGLFFEPEADQNTFGRNTARNNGAGAGPPDGSCAVQTCTGLTEPDFCDEGVDNTSFGDNLAPGPPTC